MVTVFDVGEGDKEGGGGRGQGGGGREETRRGREGGGEREAACMLVEGSLRSPVTPARRSTLRNCMMSTAHPCITQKKGTQEKRERRVTRIHLSQAIFSGGDALSEASASASDTKGRREGGRKSTWLMSL